MLYIVKGMFQMAVEANAAPEAKHTAERILRNDGIKAIALEATENGENGNGRKRRDVKLNSKKDPFIAYLDAVGFALPEIRTYLSRHKGKAAGPPDIYEARRRGKDYCQTDGSDHYIVPGVEPMDLIISLGYAEHFCLASIIKYAARYGESGNPEDLKKIADYAHILCGVQLVEGDDEGEGDAP